MTEKIIKLSKKSESHLDNKENLVTGLEELILVSTADGVKLCVQHWAVTRSQGYSTLQMCP